MKRLLCILLLFSATGYCQFVPEPDWPESIRNEFSKMTFQNADTLLIYYTYLGPWTDLPSLCNGIGSIHLLWIQQNTFSAKQISCDLKLDEHPSEFSSLPIKYFISHQKDFDRCLKFIKNQNEFITTTDQQIEYLILLTSSGRIAIRLDEDDRKNTKLRTNSWGNSIINAIDTTKYYLFKKNGR